MVQGKVQGKVNDSVKGQEKCYEWGQDYGQVQGYVQGMVYNRFGFQKKIKFSIFDENRIFGFLPNILIIGKIGRVFRKK